MSEIKWSDEQLAAIDHKKGNCLLSAGAGSGKTAVLTERIYKLVSEGADIDRFLLLTFTKAAANEMKTRTREKILKDPSLSHLASKIEEAHIETFDAFCLFLAKKFASKLNVSRDITPVEGNLLKIKFQEYVDEVVNDLYLKEDKTLLEFVSETTTKNDSLVTEMVSAISEQAEKENDVEVFLKRLIDIFDKDKLHNLLQETYKAKVESFKRFVKPVSLIEWDEEREYLDDVLEKIFATKDFDSLVDVFKPYLPARVFRSVKKAFMNEGECALHNEIKNSILSAKIDDKEGIGVFTRYEKDIIDDFMRRKKYVELFVDIFKKANDKLNVFKKDFSIYSHNEIAFMCINLFNKDEEARLTVQNMFDYIMVDEYQDTSGIQETMLNLIGNNNIFMVGDVKQSIYRFRDADCTIFQDKFEAYKKKAGGTEIDLNQSFRSREEIVNMVNKIFSKLMTKETNLIDYSNGHNFLFGQDAFNKPENLISGQNNDLEVICFSGKDDVEGSGLDKDEYEINLVADDIINKINNGFKVLDRSVRDCSFKDFAIIIDRTTNFPNIKKIFAERGIPLKIVQNTDISKDDIVKVMKSLIVLYAHHDDTESIEYKHAFVSVLRSFVYQEKDENIFKVIKDNSIKSHDLYQKMDEFRNALSDTSIHGVLWNLLLYFDFKKKLFSIENYEENVAKVDSFIAVSESMSKLEYTLNDFVDYLSGLQEDSTGKNKLEISLNPNVEDAVTLINIHKSKGLEWNICYFPFIGKQKNNILDKKVSKLFGLIPPCSKFSPTRALELIDKEDDIQGEAEERIRLFYVALTRAREKIVLLHNKDTKAKNSLLGIYKFVDYITYLDIPSNYGVDKTVTFEKLTKGSVTTKEKIDIKIDSISLEHEVKESKHASKDTAEDVDQSVLEFGTKLHYLLEICDYTTKDTSFVQDKQLRHYVNNILNSELFKGVKKEQVLNEYEFYDEEQNVNGIIDCMVIHEDYIDIIDFKLKKIDDDAYAKQLNTYKNFIKTKTNKNIKMHLISAITGEIKEIE